MGYQKSWKQIVYKQWKVIGGFKGWIDESFWCKKNNFGGNIFLLSISGSTPFFVKPLDWQVGPQFQFFQLLYYLKKIILDNGKSSFIVFLVRSIFFNFYSLDIDYCVRVLMNVSYKLVLQGLYIGDAEVEAWNSSIRKK